MKIPTWEDYDALQKQISALEKPIKAMAAHLGLAKYRFRDKVFDTLHDATMAQIDFFDAEKKKDKDKDITTPCSGVSSPPMVVIELPEL